MARDEKGDGKGKEDYEFIPPDFDEDAFIHREMVSFRTTTILFLWGIVAAAVSWALFAALDGAKVGWLVGLVVCALFGFLLRFLFPRLNADVKHFGRREWLGTGFLFFFTWLSFFILAINPPVSDFAPPRVDLHAAPPVQQAGGDVRVEAFFEDNDRVASHDLRVTGPGGPVPAALEDLGRGHFRFVAQGLPAGVYTVEATARDDRGHGQNATVQFAVVEAALTVHLPDAGVLDSPTDMVLVQVQDGLPACTVRKGRVVEEPCIRTVGLGLAGGGRVTMEHSAADGGWKATSNFAGWRPGPVSFNVTAEVRGTHAGSVFVDGGELTAGPYEVNVTAQPGTYVPAKIVGEPAAPTRSVPGPAPALAGLALLAVAAALRRRQD